MTHAATQPDTDIHWREPVIMVYVYTCDYETDLDNIAEKEFIMEMDNNHWNYCYYKRILTSQHIAQMINTWLFKMKLFTIFHKSFSILSFWEKQLPHIDYQAPLCSLW